MRLGFRLRVRHASAGFGLGLILARIAMLRPAAAAASNCRVHSLDIVRACPKLQQRGRTELILNPRKSQEFCKEYSAILTVSFPPKYHFRGLANPLRILGHDAEIAGRNP